MTARIEDYALIGDCETAALVGRDGSIDWLCLPRFDSGACFAALLGGPQHGRWQIAPAEPVRRTTRRYRGDTLILETTFETAGGVATLIDFMPPHDAHSDVIRIVVGERGTVAMQTELVIRFDYGSSVPWVSRLEDGALRAIGGPDMLVLHTTAAVRGEDFKTVGEFSVAAGERVAFALSHSASHLPPLPAIDPERALAETEGFWSAWSRRCTMTGPWSSLVKRSLMTLKALSFRPTGGIIAAPTTSLPEHVGGVRNWDYRFCWLRDSTFTLLALMGAGYYEEAEAWRDWLLRAVAGSPDQMHIVYGIAGERRLPEMVLPWLPGYEGSGPVRVGTVSAELGGQGAGAILKYTSTNRAITVDLKASQKNLAKPGDKVALTIGGKPATGTVASVVPVADSGGDDGSRPGEGESEQEFTVTITLDDQAAAGDLDAGSVDVRFTTGTREKVLAVPVGALLALAEGGYAVEVVEGANRRLVAVTPGLFADGKVEVSGKDLREGMKVVTTS